jgi:nitrogen fixation/metabolism regulation signal transduction histidine kinase
MASTLRSITTSVLPVIGLFLLMLVSLYLMSDATQNSERFGRLYISLLFFNSLILIVLLVMIGMNLFELLRQVFARTPGSRLTLRLIAIFVVLALVPVSIVYYFSYRFLEQGIDSWFDVRVEEALENALELGRVTLDQRLRGYQREAEEMIPRLQGIADDNAAMMLNELRQESRATELYLLGDQNRIIASSTESTQLPVPPDTSQEDLFGTLGTGPMVRLEPAAGTTLYVRATALIPSIDPTTKPYLLVVRFPLEERVSELAQSVQHSYAEYKELAYLRSPMKQNFILTLSLVLLLSVLFAVWAAFFSARRVMAPIHKLAEGTRAVAAGEFNRKLPVSNRDELGFLVRSFNDMTSRLSQAYAEVDLSKQLSERQRAYLETVLEHISSAVMTLDGEGMLRTINAKADDILEPENTLESYLDWPLYEIAREVPLVKNFYDSLSDHLESGDESWQEQITLFGSAGRKQLMCRGARLPSTDDQPGGYVIVFDDITDMIKAQRDAAWGEVARRLAHEIKNPLTPIQLSAERMQHKLSKELDDKSADILSRSTQTIVGQVEAMKTMVNAFSDYARSPVMELIPLDMNQLITEVVDLYRNNPARVRIKTDLDETMPHIEADSGRIRQILNNLIKNALEATNGSSTSRVEINTRCLAESGCRFMELTVTDNGPGFDEDMLGQVFEPYVTGKSRGTGLGLAIVKKVVEEHGGVIFAENCPGGGAQIRVRIPVVKTVEQQES